MNRDTIKMLAIVTMLVNHIANVFMPAGAPLTNLCLYIGYFTAVTMCYFLVEGYGYTCLLYTSPSPRDRTRSRMPSSA